MQNILSTAFCQSYEPLAAQFPITSFSSTYSLGHVLPAPLDIGILLDGSIAYPCDPLGALKKLLDVGAQILLVCSDTISKMMVRVAMQGLVRADGQNDVAHARL